MRGVRKGKNRAFVAISGGLDSSIATLLLKNSGFNVEGVFMSHWSSPQLQKAKIRARKVAKILKIPFHVFNLEKEFKKRVVNYFLDRYKKGITPNPCVVCNKEIKFGLLLEKALELDADYLATGHYVRLRQGKLFKARDKERDQSYFLWTLNQKQLKRTLFPIGDYTRKEVKNLARKFGLPLLLNIPKSVEICFIPKTVEDFLKRYLKSKSGQIIDTKGKILSRHQGLAFYTIGQRKGIGLPGGPYWVLGKDFKKDTLIVTKNEKDLCRKELVVKSINWISGKEPRLPLKAMVKIRYRHTPALAVITKNLRSSTYNLEFSQAQRSITPGQSAVFYKGNQLLGGGIIC
jgi:tRNA-specific 2-thiouridylase